MQKILSFMRRAVDDYNMINDGDRIAVGVSGGKDSLTLLAALANLKIFYPNKFELKAITLDMGFPNADFSGIQAFCDRLGVEYTVIKTDIKEIVFDIRKEENPCSLCAKMRRGILNDTAKSMGCNKVALGHHYEDVLETFFMSLFYEGRINCFSPVTYLSRKDIHVIRPLIYTPERNIKGVARKMELPIYKNPCPADGNTKRQEMKDFINARTADDKRFKDIIFGAIKRSTIDGWDGSERKFDF